MATLIEQESGKEIKLKRNNHVDEEIEIDLMDILRKIIGIRKLIYKAAGIGLVIGVIIAICILYIFRIFRLFRFQESHGK